MSISFTDRYQACGLPYPDPATCCHECDGMGCLPVEEGDEQADLRKLWEADHAVAHTLGARLRNAWTYKDVRLLFQRCDGWHFVTCPACNGTRLRPNG